MTKTKTFNAAAIAEDATLPWSIDNGDGTISFDSNAMVRDMRSMSGTDAGLIVVGYDACPEYFEAIERALDSHMNTFKDPEVRAMATSVSLKLQERREKMDSDAQLTALTMM